MVSVSIVYRIAIPGYGPNFYCPGRNCPGSEVSVHQIRELTDSGFPANFATIPESSVMKLPLMLARGTLVLMQNCGIVIKPLTHNQCTAQKKTISTPTSNNLQTRCDHRMWPSRVRSHV